MEIERRAELSWCRQLEYLFQAMKNSGVKYLEVGDIHVSMSDAPKGLVDYETGSQAIAKQSKQFGAPPVPEPSMVPVPVSGLSAESMPDADAQADVCPRDTCRHSLSVEHNAAGCLLCGCDGTSPAQEPLDGNG